MTQTIASTTSLYDRDYLQGIDAINEVRKEKGYKPVQFPDT